MTGRGGGGRPLVRFDGERILVRARQAAFRRDILGGDAHVNGVERIGEGADHHVHELRITHARAPALGGNAIAAAAHALDAARDGGIGVAQHHILRRRHNRLHAAAAKTIQRERACIVGQAAVHAREPRDVHVLRLRVNHVAEHALADLLGIDLRAAHRLLDDPCRQVARRDVLQAAAIVADGSANATQNDDFPLISHDALRRKDVDYPAKRLRSHATA